MEDKPKLGNDISILNLFNGVEARKRKSLDDAVEEYINECELRGLSDSTIANYRGQIGVFRRFTEERDLVVGSLNALRREDVRAFQSYLKSQGVSNSSINAYMRPLHAMWNNMKRKGFVKENIWDGMKIREGQKEVNFTPSKVQVQNIIASQIRKAEGNYVQFRNLVIFVFMVDTGVRVNELRNIKRSDLSLDKGKEHVVLANTKNNQVRKIGLSKRVVNLLTGYLPLVEDMPIPYLFLNRNNAQMSRREVQYVVEKLGKENAVPELNCHSLRRYFASVKIGENIPLIQMMKLLGHNDPKVTMRYYQELSDDYLDWKDLGID